MDLLTKIALRHLSTSNLKSSVKIKILRMLGMTIGNKTIVAPHVYMDTLAILIGRECVINVGTAIICGAGTANIYIGNNVQIGPNSTILGVTHDIGKKNARAGKGKYCDVKIEDGCWLGANVTVLPNVTITKGCVIAAGSVVTKSTEPNGLYAGVPAVRKRDLEKN
ncbi:acyltransferase [Loigolactobacillus jiayinensis]|uniref:Acyltransferase n=1 Tax=Loigolactobacillus jiayinensis TaxID=2486016 RepID=A0ABW1RD79_9LACO|nr:acyltransferase [Loigolactobacillus jiayinensis]